MADILIVDDSTFTRKTIREIMELAGHKVVAEAENGYIAVEMYETFKPDVVTLDIVMPRYNGVQALKDIIKLDPEAKVVMCTDVGQRAAVMKSIQIGAKNFVVKPVDKVKFVNIVNNLLITDTKHSKEYKKDKIINEENVTKQLSFDTILIKDPEYTHSLAVQDDSLKDVGYFQNDLLVFQTNISPEDGDIIIAVIDQKFTIGFYYKITENDFIIQPAKSSSKPITDKNVNIYGVVTGSVRKLKR